MELSTPHPDPPLLLGLAVFQYLQKLEYVRSIHMFKKGEYIHMIQQEFSSKGWSLSAPTHLACLSDKAHVKAYMDMVKAKQETEGWKCLVDFCTSLPRNTNTQRTQSWPLDMLLENVWAHANALFMNENNAHENHAINWEQPHCLQGHEGTKHKDFHMGIEYSDTMSQRLDLWQQWGSDLELASPRISQAFNSPSVQNASLYGATSSPMSSSVSNNNMDSASWTHKPTMVMKEPQWNGEVGRNRQGFACTLMSPNSQLESILGESPTNCIISGTVRHMCAYNVHFGQAVNNKMSGYCNQMPFDSGITQPMSSTSITYGSSDERGLEAVNSGAPDQLKDDQVGFTGFPKAKESKKVHKFGSTQAASRRLTELTKDELIHYFNMPITQASKELKVGLTVLKKRCRIFGIPRWPHRKMKSINSLINSIQDLARGDGGDNNDTSHVQVAVLDLEKQKREMQESPGTQLAERTKRLRQACFKASYRKRRQEALHDLSIDDHHNAVMKSISSNNSSSSNSFYHYCEK